MPHVAGLARQRCHSVPVALSKIRSTNPSPRPLEGAGGRSPTLTPKSCCRPRARHSAWPHGLLSTSTSPPPHELARFGIELKALPVAWSSCRPIPSGSQVLTRATCRALTGPDFFSSPRPRSSSGRWLRNQTHPVEVAQSRCLHQWIFRCPLDCSVDQPRARRWSMHRRPQPERTNRHRSTGYCAPIHCILTN